MSKKIKVAIVDDEHDGRDYISLLLSEYFPNLHLSFIASNSEDAILELQKQQPDILFLDIELGDGTAFDILSKFENNTMQIIFITAYDQHALKAIKNNAVDYILKPIDKDEFETAVTKALKNIRKDKISEMDISQEYKINLPSLHGLTRVDIKNVLYCVADGNYTHIYLADRSKVLVTKILQEFEELLSPHNFFRIHHKYLINMMHLKQYIRGKGGQVVMSDDAVLDVSTRKKADFMKKL